MYACLYRPAAPDAGSPVTLDAIAREFSPRYERLGDDLVTIDVSGLDRLFQRRSVLDTREGNRPSALASGGGGAPRSVWKIIADELRREAADRGVRVHVAIAGTCTAALILAHARPGVTIIKRGEEADALAGIAIGILDRIEGLRRSVLDTRERSAREVNNADATTFLTTFKAWGLKTLGELAALPPADLASRLGRGALVWQALARGGDIRPLIPTLDEERFESSMDLDWPIEELEPLSFVLTRLLEPLSTRLERRDRGAAVLHVLLRLVTRGSGAELYARRLELPSPMRDVRTLRTLALLDLESHPPPAGIDRVSIVIDPTPGRVLQHTLFTRAHPTPEQLSTLLARLAAVMGQDRIGAPATVDTYRPGAFAMTAFKTDHGSGAGGSGLLQSQPSASSPHSPLTSALRRCRQPVPARVAVADGRPIRVTTDRRGFAGGAVVQCAGPWRTSGEWWATDARPAGGAGRAGEAGPARAFNKDEWDISLSDGAVYRIFQDRDTDAWFIDAIVD
jgi:protein ImuB